MNTNDNDQEMYGMEEREREKEREKERDTSKIINIKSSKPINREHYMYSTYNGIMV